MNFKGIGDNWVDLVGRCEVLGIPKYAFHPGSTKGEIATDEGLKLVAVCFATHQLAHLQDSINWAHEKTKSVTIVLENTAGGGYTLGRSFEELKKIIAHVKDKARVGLLLTTTIDFHDSLILTGVCLDTCHLFAAGYDVSTKAGYEKTMKDFDEIVGFSFLKGVHINDSKSELGSNKDRHENLGKGKIGLGCFKWLVLLLIFFFLTQEDEGPSL